MRQLLVSKPRSARPAESPLLNDVHAKLNPSRPAWLARPESIGELTGAMRSARERGLGVIAAGGRHAMGGQQFSDGGAVFDMRSLRRVLALDPGRGIVEAEAGIEWPELVAFLHAAQGGCAAPWTIIQKQTGADRLTLGGAVAANIHGRGLAMAPLVQDIEGLTVVDARGELIACNRRTHADQFRHIIGGYGVCGIIYSVQLRLARRRKVRRTVRMVDADDVMPAFADRIAAGCLYGDWQFAIDDTSDAFLRRGVLSAYEPVDDGAPIPAAQRQLGEGDWRRLLLLAHTDKSRGFDEYARHYLSTDGQQYFSDAHQFGTYIPDYHAGIDAACGASVPGSEMITELYVPRARLAEFLGAARAELRARRASVIYGTVRLIERDAETVLAWAREPWACIVFNLHVDHDAAGIARAREQFRGLIDCALGCGGSFYLTYHRWATGRQVREAHPRFDQFLAAKRARDPDGAFRSDWFRQYAGE